MHFWYRLFTYLFFPFSKIYLFIRKIKKKEHFARYKEKLSKIDANRGEGFLIWLHVASVGEAMSILPLLDDFEKEKKIDRILITSITLSSGKILEKKYKKNKKIIHQFLPLDIPIFINKFLNHWSPNLSIFIESEIWPNLIFQTKERNIPLLLINARITKKTFTRWKFAKKFAKKIFEKFDLCVASNTETENYLRKLGAVNIKNHGNLKFAKANINNNLDQNLLKKIKNRKIWVASSTHNPEEILCGEVHLKIKETYKNLLTIIIPRHIERSKTIINDLKKLNLKSITYSNIENLNDATDILLIDTYGESLKFYNISKSVFLGKSLIASLINDSGQNPIEASRLGCKIYHGPNVSNFSEIYAHLKSLKVATLVNNSLELSKHVENDLKTDKVNNSEIIQKIELYGLNALTNVLKEIKIYINTKR